MVTTSPEYWAVDGVSLQTYAYNIVTIGGGRMAPPPLRGGDQLIPYSPGRRWVPKIAESNTITLGMWVIGTDENGKPPTDRDAHQRFMENWKMLVNLLWTPRRQVTVTRRIKLAGESTYRTITAKGQFSNGLNPTMQGGPARGVFTIDLTLADPYWLGDEIEILLPNATPSKTVNIIGDDLTTEVFVELSGSGTALRVANSQESSLYVQYSRQLLSTQKALINVDDFRANHDITAANTKSVGSVKSGLAGAGYWFYLAPGAATLTLSEQSGTFSASASAKVRYRPRFV